MNREIQLLDIRQWQKTGKCPPLYLSVRCARCGELGKDHQPGASYSYAKTGSSSGHSHNVVVKARTCCTIELNTCVAFIPDGYKVPNIADYCEACACCEPFLATFDCKCRCHERQKR